MSGAPVNSTLPAPGLPDLFPDIEGTFGCILLGTIIGAVLYGITLVQTGAYFARYVTDSAGMKILILLLWALDTVTFCLETQSCWFYFAENFGNKAALDIQTRSLQIESGVTYTVSFLAHMFFALRIYHLSGRKLPYLIFFSLTAFCGWALGLSITGVVIDRNSWASALDPTLDAIVITHKTLTTFNDVIIAVVMCLYLHGSRSGIRRTEQLINRLIIFAANRGVLPAVVQIFYLATFLRWKTKFAWIPLHFMVSKIYVNSVLATLNVRDILRNGLEGGPTMSFALRTIHFKSTPSENTRIQEADGHKARHEYDSYQQSSSATRVGSNPDELESKVSGLEKDNVPVYGSDNVMTDSNMLFGNGLAAPRTA